MQSRFKQPVNSPKRHGAKKKSYLSGYHIKEILQMESDGSKLLYDRDFGFTGQIVVAKSSHNMKAFKHFHHSFCGRSTNLYEVNAKSRDHHGNFNGRLFRVRIG